MFALILTSVFSRILMVNQHLRVIETETDNEFSLETSRTVYVFAH